MVASFDEASANGMVEKPSSSDSVSESDEKSVEYYQL
jgi:hypothetical protein